MDRLCCIKFITAYWGKCIAANCPIRTSERGNRRCHEKQKPVTKNFSLYKKNISNDYT